ncbi:hypothetical protein G6F43_001135 [Rhizopus delemar]|nr:hypothetical protein G6F43_001135 [Rhizopus delemar]
MNSVSQGQLKYDSSSEDESSKKKRRILPATKSNGLYLLQKFSSPNLESDRITISTHKKAFSLDKVNSIQLNRGVPDFSETKNMLKKRERKRNSKFCEQEQDAANYGSENMILSNKVPSYAHVKSPTSIYWQIDQHDNNTTSFL